MSDTPIEPPPPTARRALLMLPAIVTVVVGFIALCGVLGLKSPFVGFFFAIYWAGIRHAAWPEFLPALIGGLAGLATAWAVHLAVPQGMPMLAGVIALILVAIFLDLVRWVPMVVNTSFMIFLTLAAAPPVMMQADFGGMAIALLLAAAYFGAIIRAVSWYQARRNPGIIAQHE